MRRKIHFLLAEINTDTVHMQEIIIYSRRYCSYCTAAKSLIESHGYDYREVNLDENPELAQTVMSAARMRTVPIITVGGETVGGFTELYSAINGGEFSELVGAEPS